MTKKLKRKTYRKLDLMSENELRFEIDHLPHQIEEARTVRDNLFARLRERWSTAYVNDTEFITAYAKAELAGQEVVFLLHRVVLASRLFHERYSGKLV